MTLHRGSSSDTDHRATEQRPPALGPALPPGPLCLTTDLAGLGAGGWGHSPGQQRHTPTTGQQSLAAAGRRSRPRGGGTHGALGSARSRENKLAKLWRETRGIGSNWKSLNVKACSCLLVKTSLGRISSYSLDTTHCLLTILSLSPSCTISPRLRVPCSPWLLAGVGPVSPLHTAKLLSQHTQLYSGLTGAASA